MQRVRQGHMRARAIAEGQVSAKGSAKKRPAITRRTLEKDTRDPRLRAIKLTATALEKYTGGEDKDRPTAAERFVTAVFEGEAEAVAGLLRREETLRGELKKDQIVIAWRGTAIASVPEPDKGAKAGEKNGRQWAQRAADLVARMK